MNHIPKCKIKNYEKCQEGKFRGENLHDLELGKEFLNRAQKITIKL